LERGLVNRADRKLGRFRTFLLTALKAFVSDEYRKTHALKRMPKQGFVQMDDPDINLPVSVTQRGPDEVFIYMWASDFLKDVFAKLQAEYEQSDKAAHWEVFKQKLYEPILTGKDAPSYEHLCSQCNIESAQTAGNMVTTVKRRFRNFLRATIRPQVESEEAIDEEIRELFRIFSRMGA
jgi:RNA polymerase sigma-70 factor (ECF subfamily)